MANVSSNKLKASLVAIAVASTAFAIFLLSAGGSERAIPLFPGNSNANTRPGNLVRSNILHPVGPEDAARWLFSDGSKSRSEDMTETMVEEPQRPSSDAVTIGFVAGLKNSNQDFEANAALVEDPFLVRMPTGTPEIGPTSRKLRPVVSEREKLYQCIDSVLPTRCDRSKSKSKSKGKSSKGKSKGKGNKSHGKGNKPGGYGKHNGGKGSLSKGKGKGNANKGKGSVHAKGKSGVKSGNKSKSDSRNDLFGEASPSNDYDQDGEDWSRSNTKGGNKRGGKSRMKGRRGTRSNMMRGRKSRSKGKRGTKGGKRGRNKRGGKSGSKGKSSNRILRPREKRSNSIQLEACFDRYFVCSNDNSAGRDRYDCRSNEINKLIMVSRDGKSPSRTSACNDHMLSLCNIPLFHPTGTEKSMHSCTVTKTVAKTLS